MNALACALALLTVLAPAASADAPESQVLVAQLQDEAGCDYFSYTLTPPDYRIDEDCPLVSQTP